MNNRIDVFEVKEPVPAPDRVMHVHATLIAGEFKIERHTNSGTAYQNMKMSALCINNLAVGALVDLEKLEALAESAEAQQVLADVRTLLTVIADQADIVAKIFVLKKQEPHGDL